MKLDRMKKILEDLTAMREVVFQSRNVQLIDDAIVALKDAIDECESGLEPKMDRVAATLLDYCNNLVLNSANSELLAVELVLRRLNESRKNT